MAREGASSGEQVVEEGACADVEPFPDAVCEGEEERDGLDEMGAESVEEECLLAQGLPNEPEVELLEIAETAVD